MCLGKEGEEMILDRERQGDRQRDMEIERSETKKKKN